MFTRASRNKYRFQLRGTLSVEDLWDLSRKDLDTIYKSLSKLKKQEQEDSLMLTTSTTDMELSDKIEIVKYIFEVKKNEENEAINSKNRNEQKQKLLAILEDKKDENLKSLSPEQLQELINKI